MIATKPSPTNREPADRRWTFDKRVAELEESNQPSELWDGELILSPAPSFFHQEIVARFHEHLTAWFPKNTRAKLASPPRHFAPQHPRHAARCGFHFQGAPRHHADTAYGRSGFGRRSDLPQLATPRRIDKRDLYEQHGVKEYWLTDPEALTVEVLHLVQGAYQLLGRWCPCEAAESRLLAGFQVKVDDLFGQD